MCKGVLFFLRESLVESVYAVTLAKDGALR
jgi:hypothetical protein